MKSEKKRKKHGVLVQNDIKKIVFQYIHLIFDSIFMLDLHVSDMT